MSTDFKSASYEDWKRQLEKDLKGEAFEKLLWKNENGFTLMPYYTSEQLSAKYEPAFTHSDWDAAVEAQGKNDKDKNRFLLDALQNGATAIVAGLRNSDLPVLFEGIQLNHIRSSFDLGSNEAPSLFSYLDKHYQDTGVPLSLFTEFESDRHLDELKALCRQFVSRGTHTAIGLQLTAFHNRGCTAAFELGLMLAMTAELIESGAGIQSYAAIAVRTGSSCDYFVQLAKFRAMRRLWALMKPAFGLKAALHIIAETSASDKSISDNYNNLIRSTVDAMAAVVGGCNELLVREYDLFLKQRQKASSRLALNQQLILKEECYLDRFADIACGSYFVETLTDELSRSALAVFREVEAMGGYLSALRSGWIEEQTSQQSLARLAAIRSGTQVIVGVNKYRNEKEAVPPILTEMDVELRDPVYAYEIEQLMNPKNA